MAVDGARRPWMGRDDEEWRKITNFRVCQEGADKEVCLAETGTSCFQECGGYS
jgi:hypothetical protein